MTWETRDLPVLCALVAAFDEGVPPPIGVQELVGRTGLDADTVQAALWALAGEQPSFFEYRDASTFDGRDLMVELVTGHARRTVGTWPTAEVWADRLVHALIQAAEEEPDEARRGKLRRAADVLGGLGRDVLIDVISAVVTRGTGLS